MVSIWDETLAFVVLYKSPRDASGMVGTGEAENICHSCKTDNPDKRLCGGRNQPHTWVLRITAMYRPFHVSDPTITETEMQANVGIASSKNKIRDARLKVKNWHLEGDWRNALPTSNPAALKARKDQIEAATAQDSPVKPKRTKKRKKNRRKGTA